jgi:hypothetical protein
MPFKLSFNQIRILESLPLTGFEFNKVHGATRNILTKNDLIDKDEYDGQVFIVLSKNGQKFLDANYNGEV